MIHRDPDPKRKFVTISNDTVRDKNISLGARGLLAFILSNVDDWTMTRTRLASATGATEHEIRKHLKELTEAGYCKVVRIRREDGRGTKWHLEFYEVPVVENRPHEKEPNENGPSVTHPDIEDQLKNTNKRIPNKKTNDFIVTSLISKEKEEEPEDWLDALLAGVTQQGITEKTKRGFYHGQKD